jgi:hypothetical protein
MKSIRLYFILFALLYNFSCGEAGSATKKEVPKNAEIKFENERIDIGIIDGKSNANVDFKFKNAGNIPLSIIEARGNCHCVQAKAPEKAIEPGDSSVISISFDPEGVSTAFQRTVMVRSNATRDSVELYITGEVKRDPKEVIKKTH